MKIDLMGQRFGRLVVTGQAQSRRTPSGQLKTYWSCRCDCGTETEVTSQSLRDGRSRSCGCLSADTARARAEDLAGQRFGRLVAVERGETRSSGCTTWLCRCDCGAEKSVLTAMLKNGDALSCGCLRNLSSALRRWQGDAVGYLGLHDRIRAARGPAKSHPCADCGGPSRDWSYDGADPDERYEVVNGYRLAYSLDLGHYAARCVRCHRRHDVALRKSRGVA